MKASCLSAFGDKSVMPDDNTVSTVLGDTANIWNELRAYVTDNYPNVAGEWKYYGKAAGWSYKLLSIKRNLLFFVPREGVFRLRIVLGEKGCTCVEKDSELPEEIKQAFRDAVPYTEGRSVDIDVERREQLLAVNRLLEIKQEN